jgi:hypothetical protein
MGVAGSRYEIITVTTPYSSSVSVTGAADSGPLGKRYTTETSRVQKNKKKIRKDQVSVSLFETTSFCPGEGG